MNIYVASSWRNKLQPRVVEILRSVGHDVYDFRNPYPGNTGFAWSAIDPKWQEWTPEQYRAALQHPIAKDGYALDIGALRRCDACVLVLPSGRSASWEFPGRRFLLAALTEEVGELAKAYLQREGGEAVRKEALQVACVAMRIYEEGDETFDDVTAAEAKK